MVLLCLSIAAARPASNRTYHLLQQGKRATCVQWVLSRAAGSVPGRPNSVEWQIVPEWETSVRVGCSYPPNTVEMSLVGNKKMKYHGVVNSRQCRLVEFSSQEALSYSVFDHLRVYPRNSPELVREFLLSYGIRPDTLVRMKAMNETDYVAYSVTDLFERVLDVTGRPSRQFFQLLQKYCADSGELVLFSVISCSPSVVLTVLLPAADCSHSIQ